MELNGDKLGEQIGTRIGEFIETETRADTIDILDISRLSGGAIQVNYALDVAVTGGTHAGRHALVLRTDAPSGVATSLPRSREFAILKAVFEAGVTVPEPLWLCRDESVLGKQFYIMQRIPGVAAARHVVRIVQDDERAPLLLRLGQELARIHCVKPPRPGLEFLPVPELAPAVARIAQYRGYLDALPDPQPVLEWGLRWLELNAPARTDVTLAHSDYRTGNYMVEAGELTGILDWEFAAWSDPMEDIGWFCAKCWRAGAIEREAGGIGERDPFYHGYEQIAGRPVDAERVSYWEVMATVRWAVIALQQGQRHVSGEEPSLELALTGRILPELELDILCQIKAIDSERT